MTATAILWRAGSSWLLRQLITRVAAKYLNHDHSVRMWGTEKDRNTPGKINSLWHFGTSAGTISFGCNVSREKMCFSWITICWKNTEVSLLSILATARHVAHTSDYNHEKANSLLKRDVLKDVVTAERQQAVLLHLERREAGYTLKNWLCVRSGFIKSPQIRADGGKMGPNCGKS